MTYSPEIEHSMRMFHDSLSERDRRRYAAIEAAKLGHGGTEYVATLLGCDPKTIRQGQNDLDHLPDGLGKRVRQKGAGESRAWAPSRTWRRTSSGPSRTIRRATRCARRSAGPT
jgi:hypothetical protein